MPIKVNMSNDGDRFSKLGIFLGASVAPAFFAGIFALIPNLFDRIAAPKSKITYSSISSPSIKTGNQFSKIFSVSLVNEGSIKLTNVDATVAVPIGNIAASSLDQIAGDRPEISRLNDGVRLTVRSMFPKERVGITVLITSQSPSLNPKIAVRSDQVLGEQTQISANPTTDTPEKFFFLFPSLGAALAAPTVFFLRKRNPRLFDIDRKDAISAISNYLDLPDINSLSMLDREISYAQFSDILFRMSKNNDEIAERCILALKSLLIAPMAKTSREIVESHLAELGKALDETSKSRVTDLIKLAKDRHQFRSVVRSIFDGSVEI